MSSLDTILVDVLNQRLKAGDAVVLHFHDDEEGDNWLVKSVSLEPNCNVTLEPKDYVCFKYFVPCGFDSFAMSIEKLNTNVELVQVSKGFFQVNIDARLTY